MLLLLGCAHRYICGVLFSTLPFCGLNSPTDRVSMMMQLQISVSPRENYSKGTEGEEEELEVSRGNRKRQVQMCSITQCQKRGGQQTV